LKNSKRWILPWRKKREKKRDKKKQALAGGFLKKIYLWTLSGEAKDIKEEV